LDSDAQGSKHEKRVKSIYLQSSVYQIITVDIRMEWRSIKVYEDQDVKSAKVFTTSSCRRQHLLCTDRDIEELPEHAQFIHGQTGNRPEGKVNSQPTIAQLSVGSSSRHHSFLPKAQRWRTKRR